MKIDLGPKMVLEIWGEYCKCAKIWIDLILLRKAPAEGRKFERKMADVENQAREGEQNIDTNQRESLFNVINISHICTLIVCFRLLVSPLTIPFSGTPISKLEFYCLLWDWVNTNNLFEHELIQFLHTVH